jgi:hypothetical protein
MKKQRGNSHGLCSVLSKNQLSGKLDMSGNISQKLQSVDLSTNNIGSTEGTQNYKKELV